jgi:hypothetical protein
MCLATIDQFFATCSNPRWHRWNNIKFARYILLGAVIVWILHGIPFALYWDHILSPTRNTSSCVVSNVIFQKYSSLVFQVFVAGMIPLTIMILFGILAYRNVQNIAYRAVPLVRRELDKQLTKMVLAQVLYDIPVVLPIVIQNISSFIIDTSNDSFALQLMTFMRNLAYILYYFHYVVCINLC